MGTQFLQGAAGFGKGLLSGFREGAQMAQQKKANEQIKKLREQQANTRVYQSLLNVLKVPDAKSRKALFQFLAPKLGIEASDPQFKALSDAIVGTEDPDMTQAIAKSFSDMGVKGVDPKLIGYMAKNSPDELIMSLAKTAMNLRQTKESQKTSWARMEQDKSKENRVATGEEAKRKLNEKKIAIQQGDLEAVRRGLDLEERRLKLQEKASKGGGSSEIPQDNSVPWATPEPAKPDTSPEVPSSLMQRLGDLF